MFQNQGTPRNGIHIVRTTEKSYIWYGKWRQSVNIGGEAEIPPILETDETESADQEHTRTKPSYVDPGFATIPHGI